MAFGLWVKNYVGGAKKGDGGGVKRLLLHLGEDDEVVANMTPTEALTASNNGEISVAYYDDGGSFIALPLDTYSTECAVFQRIEYNTDDGVTLTGAFIIEVTAEGFTKTDVSVGG